MITNYQLEERVFEYFDAIFNGSQTQFGFNSNSEHSFIVDRQSNSPRPAVSTVLYFRVDPPVSLGNQLSDYAYINRSTGLEQIDYHRQVRVTVNILSKLKGMSKSAMLYLQALNQTSRHYEACYNTGDFNLACNSIENNFRDLSSIENSTWTERVEADLYFNYKDVIILTEPNSLIIAPSTVSLTKDKVDFDIELK